MRHCTIPRSTPHLCRTIKSSTSTWAAGAPPPPPPPKTKNTNKIQLQLFYPTLKMKEGHSVRCSGAGSTTAAAGKVAIVTHTPHADRCVLIQVQYVKAPVLSCCGYLEIRTPRFDRRACTPAVPPKPSTPCTLS